MPQARETKQHKRFKPTRFENVQQLENMIDYYLDAIPEEKWTITGLAMACGFRNRASFDQFRDNHDEYRGIIEWARSQVERSYEVAAKNNKSSNGPIFILKNMGWKDSATLEVTDGAKIIRHPNKREYKLSGEEVNNG